MNMENQEEIYNIIRDIFSNQNVDVYGIYEDAIGLSECTIVQLTHDQYEIFKNVWKAVINQLAEYFETFEVQKTNEYDKIIFYKS